MTRGDTTPSHLNIFDWVCEPKSAPTSIIHPCPLLVSAAGNVRHGCGCERRKAAKLRKGYLQILQVKEERTITWLYKRNGLISANKISPLDRKPPSAPPFLASKCPSHLRRSHPTPCCFAGSLPNSPSGPSKGSQQVLIVHHSPLDLEGMALTDGYCDKKDSSMMITYMSGKS